MLQGSEVKKYGDLSTQWVFLMVIHGSVEDRESACPVCWLEVTKSVWDRGTPSASNSV